MSSPTNPSAASSAAKTNCSDVSRISAGTEIEGVLRPSRSAAHLRRHRDRDRVDAPLLQQPGDVAADPLGDPGGPALAARPARDQPAYPQVATLPGRNG